ncbi:hypothetical protein Plhal304r1_c016g0058921 [Plasmopara halstedii]
MWTRLKSLLLVICQKTDRPMARCGNRSPRGNYQLLHCAWSAPPGVFRSGVRWSKHDRISNCASKVSCVEDVMRRICKKLTANAIYDSQATT